MRPGNAGWKRARLSAVVGRVPTEPATPLLSPTQRGIVGVTLTLLAFIGSVTLVVGVIVAVGWLAGFFSGVLWPLALAGVLALILRPVVVLLETRLKLRRLTAVLLLYGVFVLVVAGG